MSRRYPRRRLPAVVRLVVIVSVLTTFATAAFLQFANPAPATAPLPARGPAGWQELAASPGTPGPGGDASRRTLVLYDEGPAGLGKSYGMQAANLVSRGSSYVIKPVDDYRDDEANAYTGMVYVGSSGRQVPPGFLADIASGSTPPVLWIGFGINRLFTAHPDLSARWGWRPDGRTSEPLSAVIYKDQQLRRDSRAGAGTPRIAVSPDSRAEVLATALGPGDTRAPYAVRAANVTYVADIPFDYVGVSDRYLAVADLIREIALPEVPDRRRALVRLEDVGPTANPEQLREIADYLHSAGVPFTVAVYPHYLDPTGQENGGTPTSLWLTDAPDVVDALQYIIDHGGTVLMHGVSHQYSDVPNPYNGVSASDFEFYRAHVDEENYVRMDGPVAEDSPEWATNRINRGRGEFDRVGLPAPSMFEFPHYAGSAVDYLVVNTLFGVRYDQGTYFPDSHAAPPDPDTVFQQYFPYPVRDTYGSVVVPENLGNIAPEAYNNNPPRLPEDLIDAARSMQVVRDGVASFFYHPFLGVDRLRQTVEGISALGYRFVTPESIATEPVRGTASGNG